LTALWPTRDDRLDTVARIVNAYLGHTATIDGFLRALGKKFGQDIKPIDA
jgi:hypothetical protein